MLTATGGLEIKVRNTIVGGVIPGINVEAEAEVQGELGARFPIILEPAPSSHAPRFRIKRIGKHTNGSGIAQQEISET